MNKKTQKMAALMAVMASSGTLHAQTQRPGNPPENLVTLSASATVEVQQDVLAVSLNTLREGSDASTVQSQLKAALDAALKEAQQAARPGQMEVRTGAFSLQPRYDRNGKMTGWQGSTELVLEGRDFGRISSTAGKIQTLTIGSVAFSLSREQRAKAESLAQAQAIERYKAKASEIAKGFGFDSYTLRDISVSAEDHDWGGPRPRMMAMAGRAGDSDEVPVQAGRAQVVITVSGSVQLR